MNVSFSKDVLNSGWSALREECNKSSDGLFLNMCSSLNLLDSRDTDFNKIENRLAYMYKFGDSVKFSVETCISNFFKQCSGEEMIYFSNNLKICSLSNGPGLDIIGYLSALIKSDKVLNGYPILKAINLYNTWRDLFQRVTAVVYEHCATSNFSCDQNLSKNIQFIQCDIFTTLLPEAKECIENSDILLMCKVFSSTKANPEIVSNTLKEILILLRPGSVLFFIGSKRNVKNVSSLCFLKEYVEIKFGPLKITPLDVDIPDATGLKPEQSDKSYFMVMQKKGIVTKQENINTLQGISEKSSKKSRRKRNKKNVILTPSVSSCDISITDNSSRSSSSKVEDTDFDSSISIASSCKKHDITSDELESVSFENVSHLEVAHLEDVTADSINKIKSESAPCHTFQTKSQTSLEKNNNTEHSFIENVVKSILENILEELDDKSNDNNFRNMSEENVSPNGSKSILMEIIGSYSNNKDDSLNEINSNDTLPSAPKKSDDKFYKASLDFEKLIQSKHFSVNSSNQMVPTFSPPLKYVPPHKRNAEVMSPDQSTFNMEETKFVNDVDCLDRKINIKSKVNFENRSRKSSQEISTQINKACENSLQILKKNTDCCEERKKEKSNDNFKTIFKDSIHSTVINSTPFAGKESKTKSETKQTETRKFSFENSFQSAANNSCTKEFISTRNKDAFHSMIERCENLVTALDGLVTNISKNVDLIDNQRSEKNCCRRESYTNYRHSCTYSDYFYEQSCLKKKCCCKRTMNHACMDIPPAKSVCSRTCNHQMHTCSYDIDNSSNFRQPYLVLPVENKDIPFILKLVTKNS